MHSFRSLRFAFAGFALLAASAASALDLDGIYENTGSAIALATSPVPDAVSFQGLLELNFSYAVAHAQHGDSRRVMLRETPTHFKIQCLDDQDKVTWTGTWEKGAGCTVGENQIDLTFHNAKLKYDSYLFSLQRMAHRDLLLVEVTRVNATPLGPSVHSEGTFLFGRIAPK